MLEGWLEGWENGRKIVDVFLKRTEYFGELVKNFYICS